MTTLGVIGASGTLGRVAVKSLLDADSELQIRALVRRDDAELSSLSRCTLDSGGLFDFEALDNLCRNSDVVVNLAARNPEGQETDLNNLESFLLTNGLGAAAVAAAAARHDTPLIHFSTVAVYETGEYREGDYLTEGEPLPGSDDRIKAYFDGTTIFIVAMLKAASAEDVSSGRIDAWREYCESSPYPSDGPVYGLTKLIGEQAVLQLGGPVCCVRMSDVYGPGHESRGVITDHLAALKRKTSVVVDFDFRATASFIFIDDVVRFIAVLSEKLSAGEELPAIVNLVGSCLDEEQLRDELGLLARKNGLDRSITAVDNRSVKSDRRYSRALFEASFPECQETTISEGLSQTWGCYQEQD